MHFLRPSLALLSSLVLTAAATSDTNWPSDLVSRMQSHSAHSPDVYNHALKVMEGLKTSPSCIQLAVTSLVDTCQSLDSKGNAAVASKDTEVALDEVKSEFAARLAMCELSGAQATLPEACMAMIPSKAACPKSRFSSFFTMQASLDDDDKLCYPTMQESSFKECLSALDSRPQWWTSYSNARQNAVVICQASRDVVEKDNILGVYKSLTEVIFNVTSEMQKSMQEHAAALEERQEYAKFLQSMQEEATQAFKNGHQDALSTFASYLNDMQDAFKAETQRMTRSWTETEARVEQLSEIIHHSSSGLQRLHEDTSSSFQGMLNQVALHMDAQQQKLQSGYDMAVATLDTIHAARQAQIEALDQTSLSLHDIRAQMQNIEHDFSGMRESQESMYDGFVKLEESFFNLTTKAHQLDIMLQGAAGTAQQIFAAAATSFGFLNQYWPILLFAGTALIIRDRLIIGIITMSAVAFWLYTSLTTLRARSDVFEPESDGLAPWLLIGMAIGSTFSICTILYMTLRRKVLHFGEGFVLPSIEMPSESTAIKPLKKWLI